MKARPLSYHIIKDIVRCMVSYESYDIIDVCLALIMIVWQQLLGELKWSGQMFLCDLCFTSIEMLA
jgi:hypothetical protein